MGKKMSKEKKLIGYKGFDSDLKCRGEQYVVGETHVHEGKVALCSSGLHFCEYPLDVLGYYSPNTSRFAVVETDDASDEKRDDDTKRVAKSLHIKAEVNLPTLIQAAVDFTFSNSVKVKGTTTKKKRGAASATGESGAASATGESGAASATGWSGAASATGESGAASATGWRGAASATGWSGAASATGKEGIAMSVGIEGRAKAALDNWIVLSEWKVTKGEWHRISTKAFLVDGKKLKEDTYYTLRNGRAVKA